MKNKKYAEADRNMKFLVRLLIRTAVLAVSAALLFTFVIGVDICSGNRMHPSLKDGDLVITCRLGKLRLGDIVRYKDPETGKTCFSRICGLPGYTIDITESGGLMTNGYTAAEEVFYRTEKHEGSSVTYPLTVPGSSYFLLDDYRTIGHDSRDFGEVDGICGKVIFVIRRRGF